MGVKKAAFPGEARGPCMCAGSIGAAVDRGQALQADADRCGPCSTLLSRSWQGQPVCPGVGEGERMEVKKGVLIFSRWFVD